MELTQYVPAELYGLVAALWVIGYFLKKSNVKDYYIPWILLVLSIVFSMLILGITPQSAIAGVICSAVAVLGKNLEKQTLEAISASKEDKKEEIQ